MGCGPAYQDRCPHRRWRDRCDHTVAVVAACCDRLQCSGRSGLTGIAGTWSCARPSGGGAGRSAERPDPAVGASPPLNKRLLASTPLPNDPQERTGLWRPGDDPWRTAHELVAQAQALLHIASQPELLTLRWPRGVPDVGLTFSRTGGQRTPRRPAPCRSRARTKSPALTSVADLVRAPSTCRCPARHTCAVRERAFTSRTVHSQRSILVPSAP